MENVFLINMQLVKEGKLFCKQNKCRFYHNCDNYNCTHLEIAEKKEQTNERNWTSYSNTCSKCGGKVEMKIKEIN